MFLAVPKDRKIRFSGAADLASLKEAEINDGIKLADIINSGKPLYLRVGNRIPKALLQVVLRCFVTNGDVSNVHLFSQCDLTGNWSFVRPCTGYTLSVVADLASWYFDDDLSARFRDHAVGSHPANNAVSFLLVDGGDEYSLRMMQQMIGDIRHAMMRSAEDSYAAETAVNNLHVLRGAENFCRILTPPMKRAITEYVKSLKGKQEFSPLTFEDYLVLATYGLPGKRMRAGTFAADVQANHAVLEFGMTLACVASLKLFVTAWAASEFHTDLLDESVFYACAPDRAQAHLLRFRKICNG